MRSLHCRGDPICPFLTALATWKNDGRKNAVGRSKDEGAVMKRAGSIAAWRTLNNTIRECWSRAFTGPKELILVAESNHVLRGNLMDVLRDAHYRTIEACDGAEAVRIGARCRRQIHLLMTGVRLPDLIGWELGELLRLDHPAVAVVYVAHNFQDWRRLGSKRFESLFLQAPFGP